MKPNKAALVLAATLTLGMAGAAPAVAAPTPDAATFNAQVLEALNFERAMYELPELQLAPAAAQASALGHAQEMDAANRDYADPDFAAEMLASDCGTPVELATRTPHTDPRTFADVLIYDHEAFVLNPDASWVAMGTVLSGTAGLTSVDIRLAGSCGTAPVLTGTDDVEIQEGDYFDAMYGVNANDVEAGDLTNEIAVSGTVDANVPGTYTLTYSVSDALQTVTATRVVTVTAIENTPPEIRGVLDTTVDVGGSIDLAAGVTAWDAEDGDLTDELVIDGNVNTEVPGNYEVSYSVTDSGGATHLVVRTITVVEVNTHPEILGVEDTTHVARDWTYRDLRKGVTATDAEDGDLTYRLENWGEYHYNLPGTYTVTYQIMDDDGAVVQKQRTITVLAETAENAVPNITYDSHSAITVFVSDNFDPMADVWADDVQDGDMTDQIQVVGAFDAKTPGTYKFEYVVIDSDSNMIRLQRTVTVKADAPPVITDPPPTDVAPIDTVVPPAPKTPEAPLAPVAPVAPVTADVEAEVKAPAATVKTTENTARPQAAGKQELATAGPEGAQALGMLAALLMGAGVVLRMRQTREG